jgi:nicotinate-nucleotide adenylyltransferase
VSQDRVTPSSVWPRFPLSAPGMRIGLLGGSFNPAHEGHRQITLAAMARLQLDRVWWLVTPGNPLKDAAGLLPLAERMRQAARIATHPRIDITGVEASLGTQYTAETLAWIQARQPSVRFVWLMGADNLAQFHRWRSWRSIIERMPIAIVDRPGWRLRALASPAAMTFAHARLHESQGLVLMNDAAPAWIFLSVPLSPLSSTAIRAAHNAGRTPSMTRTPR